MMTPKSIVFLVIGTISVAAISVLWTICYTVVFQIPVGDPSFQALRDAGTFFFGALTGALMNTRSASQITTTTVSSEPEPEVTKEKSK